MQRTSLRAGWEILALLATGDLCKEIAVKLDLTLRTVHTHPQNIYGTLHVRSRTRAVLKYNRAAVYETDIHLHLRIG